MLIKRKTQIYAATAVKGLSERKIEANTSAGGGFVEGDHFFQIIQFGIYLFLIKGRYFSSFKAGICVSNSSPNEIKIETNNSAA